MLIEKAKKILGSLGKFYFQLQNIFQKLLWSFPKISAECFKNLNQAFSKLFIQNFH